MEQIKVKLVENSVSISIDSISLIEFLSSAETVKQLKNEIESTGLKVDEIGYNNTSYLVHLCRVYEITNIKALEEIIVAYLQKIKHLFTNFYHDRTNGLLREDIVGGIAHWL